MRTRLVSSFLALALIATGCAVAADGDAEDAPAATEDPLQQTLGPDPRGAAVKNPIVLVHGFAASTTFFGFSDAIVSALAEAHGGSATVSSEPGAGATFTISLPLAKQP